MFSETKKFKAQKDKLKSVFDVLTQIEHPNIVKFHRYVTRKGTWKVGFITVKQIFYKKLHIAIKCQNQGC